MRARGAPYRHRAPFRPEMADEVGRSKGYEYKAVSWDRLALGAVHLLWCRPLDALASPTVALPAPASAGDRGQAPNQSQRPCRIALRFAEHQLCAEHRFGPPRAWSSNWRGRVHAGPRQGPQDGRPRWPPSAQGAQGARIVSHGSCRARRAFEAGSVLGHLECACKNEAEPLGSRPTGAPELRGGARN